MVITGYKKISSKSPDLSDHLKSSVNSLSFRGPDFQDYLIHEKVGLGHTRLSIIDTSHNANQPMCDSSGRYILIFNGEIYNYKSLKNQLRFGEFKSNSDTEVLLHLLIEHGKKCLRELNGFFALAFYDKVEDYLLIARDRMGIKPCHYYSNDDYLVFGSEMKALMSYPIPRIINQQALYWYLRLTYLPHDLSLIDGVKKITSGTFFRDIRKTILRRITFF